MLQTYSDSNAPSNRKISVLLRKEATWKSLDFSRVHIKLHKAYVYSPLI